MSECNFNELDPIPWCKTHNVSAFDCLRDRINDLIAQQLLSNTTIKELEKERGVTESIANHYERRIAELEKERDETIIAWDQCKDSVAVLMKTVENQNAIRDELVSQLTKFASDPETAEVYLAEWKRNAENQQARAEKAEAWKDGLEASAKFWKSRNEKAEAACVEVLAEFKAAIAVIHMDEDPDCRDADCPWNRLLNATDVGNLTLAEIGRARAVIEVARFLTHKARTVEEKGAGLMGLTEAVIAYYKDAK